MKQVTLNPNFNQDESFVVKKSRVILFSLLFMLIYLIVDYLNMPYKEMMVTYGIGLVITNVILNFMMATLSGVLLALSEGLFQAKKAMLHGEKLVIYCCVVWATYLWMHTMC